FAFGKVVFWPKRVHYEPGLGTGEQDIPTKGIWPKVARSVQHRPRVIWLVTAVVLLAGAVGVTQLKAEGVAQSELVLGASEARWSPGPWKALSRWFGQSRPGCGG